jgi:hypothetical protein
MGCGGSTTASAPPASGGQAETVQPQAQQQQQPGARPVATNQLDRLPGQQPQAGQQDNCKSAPIVKSLVDLKRESCSVEKTKDGIYIKLKFSSLSDGEVIAHFNVTEKAAADSKSMSSLDAAQVSKQSFSSGLGQNAKLFLCKDLEAGLANFKEAKDHSRHQVVIDLKADSSSSESPAVNLQRSCLKLNGDNTAFQVTAQKVRCGQVIRTLEALYGTMPRAGAMEASNSSGGDAESGECVICLSKPREVAILHCRHVCLCRSCAKITSSTWSFQCPVCRGRVAAMVHAEGVS